VGGVYGTCVINMLSLQLFIAVALLMFIWSSGSTQSKGFIWRTYAK